MSIEDDVALLERIPTLRLLGNAALRVIAIGSDQQEFARGAVMFRQGEQADCGYVVQEGGFRLGISDASTSDVVVERGALIGELALIVPMQRPATATATEFSSVIRITRTLFQRVLDSDPAAARRLRDELADRSSQIASNMIDASAKLRV